MLLSAKRKWVRYEYSTSVKHSNCSIVESCMLNHSPGSPELSVLSFKSGFHGRLFGSLSATRSKAIHKVHNPFYKINLQASKPDISFRLTSLLLTGPVHLSLL